MDNILEQTKELLSKKDNESLNTLVDTYNRLFGLVMDGKHSEMSDDETKTLQLLANNVSFCKYLTSTDSNIIKGIEKSNNTKKQRPSEKSYKPFTTSTSSMGFDDDNNQSRLRSRTRQLRGR